VKKKIIYLAMSFFLVASLISGVMLTSCGTKTTSTTNVVTTTTPVTPDANAPKYGGTLTVATDWMNEDPGGFDAGLTPKPWSTSVWDAPFLCWMMVGDIDKYGPRGNNTFPFQTTEMVPEQYLMGPIGESWEVQTTPTVTFTFQIRHNVMWAGNSLLNMSPRELTADDVVWSMTRSEIGTMVEGNYKFITGRTAVDRYTVRLDCSSFDANWAYYLGYGYMPGCITCPESGNATIGGGSEDWKNQVSDGPFIVSDYVAGSYVKYTKNDNYWEKTTINGKEYQLPFIQTLVYPIIPEEATRIANLRNGQLDWWGATPTQYGQTLNSTSPAMVQNNYPSDRVLLFKMNRIDNQYLKVKDVRRALFIGTDLATVRDLVYPGGDLLGWPVAKGDPAYTAIENLPASTKELFTYDVTKAKALLAGAGFGSGFKVTVQIAANDDQQAKVAQILVDEWAKLNVTLTIQVLDSAAFTANGNNRAYDINTMIMSTANPIVPENWAHTVPNPPNNSNIYLLTENFTTMYQTMIAESNVTTRTQDIKNLAIAMIDDAAWIPFANPNNLNCYWPWMKNYYNETDTGYHNAVPMISRVWIDTTLKSSLGH
jgi:peptide/nickel transport system substrate-binding protein